MTSAALDRRAAGLRTVVLRPAVSRADVALAVVAVAAMLFSVVVIGAGAVSWPVLLWAVLLGGPLALRRRHPAVVAVIVATAFLAGQLAGVPEYLFSQVALLLVLYSVGGWEPNRRLALIVRIAVITAIFAVGAIGIALLLTGRTAPPAGLSTSSAATLTVLTNALGLAMTFVFGETAWRARERTQQLEARTEELVVERAKAASNAVAVERLRIARELHDVVAHHVSLIGIQAAAGRLQRGTADDARAVLTGIEIEARRAVAELHTTLRALRTDPGEERLVLPLPGAAGIRALVAEAIGAGQRVRLDIDQDLPALEPGRDLVLQRVVQEGLTNARKHGDPDAPTNVRLDCADGVLRLEIRNAVRAPVTQGSISGLGLTGMRERVEVYGGDVTTGAGPDGWRLLARLPVTS